jgi:hypothetical protein
MAKKLLKKLKKAAPLIAAGLGAAALGRAANRMKQNKTFLEEEGGDRSTIASGPFITKRKNNRGNTAEMLNFGDAFSYMPGMKKGGRVGVGKAKRGFGRAMMKRGKK